MLSGLLASGGGVLVGTFGLDKTRWELGTPGLVRGGVLNTLDFWSAGLTGLLYVQLTTRRLSSSFNTSSQVPAIVIRAAAFLDQILGVSTVESVFGFKGFTNIWTGDLATGAAAMGHDEARGVCVLVLAAMLLGRAVLLSSRNKPQAKKVKAKRRVQVNEKEASNGEPMVLIQEKQAAPSDNATKSRKRAKAKKVS